MIDNNLANIIGYVASKNKMTYNVKPDKICKKLHSRYCIEREVRSIFEKWIANDNKQSTLYVYGTYKVGKSVEVLKFAYSHFTNIVYIPVNKDNIAVGFGSKSKLGNLTRQQIMIYLHEHTIFTESDIDNENTVIILDDANSSEIHVRIACAINRLLKSRAIVVSNRKIDTLNNVSDTDKSEVTEVRIYPMTFREYLRCFYITDRIFDKNSTSSISKLWDSYTIIGGYPSVVYEMLSKFKGCLVTTTGLDIVKKAHKLIGSLITDIANDMYVSINNGKISKEHNLNLMVNTIETVMALSVNRKLESLYNTHKNYLPCYSEIYNRVANSISNGNKNNILRQYSVAMCISIMNWLQNNDIIHSCNQITGNDFTTSKDVCRYYVIDFGILNYCTREIHNVNSDMLNKGSQSSIQGYYSENYAYSELAKFLAYTDGISQLYPYFSVCKDVNGNIYEVDFIFSSSVGNVGVEIKHLAVPTNKPKSLRKYLLHNIIDTGIVAVNSATSVMYKEKFGDMDAVPIYCLNALLSEQYLTT